MEKKRTILVVDDEPNIRLLAKSILDKDFVVLEASDGDAALNIARSQKPDLILMDIMMPKMDGYTACSTIKTDQKTKAIPVVMVTGVGYQLNKELARQFGANDYLTKPFTPQELLATVDKFL